jgi:hypothetical protein
MTQTSKKEEIQHFRSQATEADFQKLKEKVGKGEITVSIGRDKSRRLLKKTQAAYYYGFLILAIALALLTVYLVGQNNRWYTAFSFATTVTVMMVFWRSMTRRMSAWSMKGKNNFDYAFYSNVISIKKGDEEYQYPDSHWKDVL